MKKIHIIIPLTILIWSCGNTKKDNEDLMEIEAFKSIRLNSRIESAPFFSDITIEDSTKNEFLDINRGLLHKYSYDSLFGKYEVQNISVGVFRNKIWLVNARVNVPYEGNANQEFQKMFITKYGKPDSTDSENWSSLWKKENYIIRLEPMDKYIDLTDTLGKLHKLTYWTIYYRSEPLFNNLEAYRDSIKKIKLKEI